MSDMMTKQRLTFQQYYLVLVRYTIIPRPVALAATIYLVLYDSTV